MQRSINTGIWKPLSGNNYIKEELGSTRRVTVEMHDSIMKCERFSFLFGSLQLDVLRMSSSLCGSCSKYLTASREQQPTTSEVQPKAGMTERWHVDLRARNRMLLDILGLIELFHTEAPSKIKYCSQKNSEKVVSTGEAPSTLTPLSQRPKPLKKSMSI